MAAFRAAGVRPVGLGTVWTLGSSATSSAAISSVRSVDGPSAITTSISPGVLLLQDVPDGVAQMALLVEHRHDHGDGGLRAGMGLGGSVAAFTATGEPGARHVTAIGGHRARAAGMTDRPYLSLADGPRPAAAEVSPVPTPTDPARPPPGPPQPSARRGADARRTPARSPRWGMRIAAGLACW